ncbi:MAG: radical SAM protein [Thermoplasmata archaeon]|nr:MAG: radical SAM protein [Thermoplasmata archaeon]
MSENHSRELLENTFGGSPPTGCLYCDKGAKLVIYVTGLCNQGCFYCPLSEEKKDRDVVFANEARAESLDDILREARRMRALGAGITGGDPLLKLERVVDVVEALKKEFGESFHIHLYSAGLYPSEHFKRISEAGVDEVRFHPPVDMWRYFHPALKERPEYVKRYMEMIDAAKEEGMDVGMEIPSVPGEEEGMVAIVEYAFSTGLGFVNINELEVSHTNAEEMMKRGLYPLEDSAAVEGSRESALEVIQKALSSPGRGEGTTVLHFCSAYFKDAVQLRERLKRTAENVARDFEVVSEDGTLLLGLIEDIGKEEALELAERYEIPGRFYSIDVQGRRMEIGAWILEEIASEIPYRAYFIERYPTADGLEVERTPLN